VAEWSRGHCDWARGRSVLCWTGGGEDLRSLRRLRARGIFKRRDRWDRRGGHSRVARYARSWNESASITSTGPLSEVLVIGAFSFHASGQRPDSREWPYSGKSFTTR